MKKWFKKVASFAAKWILGKVAEDILDKTKGKNG